MICVGGNAHTKSCPKTFRASLGNSGKNLSHPPKFACSYTYAAKALLLQHMSLHRVVSVHVSELQTKCCFEPPPLFCVFCTFQKASEQGRYTVSKVRSYNPVHEVHHFIWLAVAGTKWSLYLWMVDEGLSRILETDLSV